MRTNNLNLLIISIVGLAVAIGCGSFTKGKPAAEKAVGEFHQLLNDGNFQQIYDESDQAMKDAASAQQLTELLEAVSRKLGKVQSTSTTQWRTGNFNLQTQVVLVQTTKFDAGEATETFTYRIVGEKAVLQGYNINSMVLITK